MKSSLFLFDLDGTLLDSAGDILTVAKAIAKEHNQPLPDEDRMRSGVSGGVALVLSRIFKLPIDDDFILSLREDFLQRYLSNGYHSTKLFVGIDKLLTELNELGIPWGIITNKSRQLTEITIDFFSPLQANQVLVCADDLGKLKPDPAGLIYAAKYLNVPVNQCLYLGDNSKDTSAAKAAGMKALVAGWGYIDSTDTPDKWQADEIFTSVDDFYQNIHRL